MTLVVSGDLLADFGLSRTYGFKDIPFPKHDRRPVVIWSTGELRKDIYRLWQPLTRNLCV
jgi:hypothetical protein